MSFGRMSFHPSGWVRRLVESKPRSAEAVFHSSTVSMCLMWVFLFCFISCGYGCTSCKECLVKFVGALDCPPSVWFMCLCQHVFCSLLSTQFTYSKVYVSMPSSCSTWRWPHAHRSTCRLDGGAVTHQGVTPVFLTLGVMLYSWDKPSLSSPTRHSQTQPVSFGVLEASKLELEL